MNLARELQQLGLDLDERFPLLAAILYETGEDLHYGRIEPEEAGRALLRLARSYPALRPALLRLAAKAGLRKEALAEALGGE